MQKAKLIVLFAVIVSINTCVIGGKTMPFHSLSAGVPGPPGPAGPGTFTEETSILSVRDYGAIGDGVTGDRNAIYNAIAAASNRELLFPAGTYRVESDLTSGSKVALRFLNGARLSIDSGVTVTINGPLEAGLCQIFSGDGSVSLGTASVNEVYPQWWGAKADGITDDTAALQNAIDAGSSIFLTLGDYLISSPLSAGGKVIRGEGMNRSRIVTNDNNINMLLPDQSQVYDIGIVGSGSAGIGCGIYLNSFGLADFYNVKVTKCQVGVRIRNAWDVSFYSCEFGGPAIEYSNIQHDADIDSSDPNDQSSQIRFINTRFMSKNLSGYHLRLVSAVVGIASGCTFAYGTGNTAISLFNSFAWAFVEPSFELVNYAFNANNSHFTVTSYYETNCNGLLDASSSTNNSITYITDGSIRLISGSGYEVGIDASDGFGNPFKISREWGPTGDEDMITVTSNGAPYYEQNYQWGSGRAGSHTWYAGKSETVSLDRTGRLSLLTGPLVTRPFQTLINGDTTPSVSAGNNFRTANTGTTNITTFDDGANGQEIRIVFTDDNTKIDFTGTNLKGNGGADWSPSSGDHMTCVFDGTNWYCDCHDNTA